MYKSKPNLEFSKNLFCKEKQIKRATNSIKHCVSYWRMTVKILLKKFWPVCKIENVANYTNEEKLDMVIIYQ